jgi:protein O-mannosyl-transferase
MNRITKLVCSSWSREWLFGLLLVAATFLVYWPALSGQFVWDDDSWTTKIAGLLRTNSGLCAIWCQFTALQQYYPLTGTTFWLDYQLWGFWPLPYHVENILLHTVAVLLFWKLLRRLDVPGAWLAAAIFALHPVMVESVAWITERKNVLSLVLYLGSLLAYLRYTQGVIGDQSTPRINPAGRCQVTRTNSILSLVTLYALALVLFLGAMLAKATAFSLPAVVLVILWWKRGRVRWGVDVLPTLPFFSLAIGLCLVTAWLEKNHVGAKGTEWAITLPGRCLIAGRVPWFYLGKLVWPANLCFIYPRWKPDVESLRQWIYPASALAALIALWLARGRIGRGPVAAVLCFGGTLFPVLGFINTYGMRYSFVWDHWVYLPSLGIIALVAAVAVCAAGWLRRPVVFQGFAVLVLLVLAVLTWRQCGMYTDLETLWRITIDRNPDSWLAHNNIGTILSEKGRADEAMTHFQKALEIQPDYAETYNNIGIVFFDKGQMDEAISQFQ